MARESCRAVQGSSNLIGIYCARHSSSSNSIASNLRQFKSNNNKLRWAHANALVRSRCPFGRNGGEGRGGGRQDIEEFAAEDLSFFDLAAMLLRLWHLWHRLRLQSASASTSFANEALKMPMKRKLPQIVAIWQLAYIASQGCHTHTMHANENCSPALIEPKPAAMRPRPEPAWAANSPVHLVSSSRTRTATPPPSPLSLHLPASLHLSLLCFSVVPQPKRKTSSEEFAQNYSPGHLPLQHLTKLQILFAQKQF